MDSGLAGHFFADVGEHLFLKLGCEIDLAKPLLSDFKLRWCSGISCVEQSSRSPGCLHQRGVLCVFMLRSSWAVVRADISLMVSPSPTQTPRILSKVGRANPTLKQVQLVSLIVVL